jgi:EAL domain-containing protein (putative c-di-GMP-specific phosphodiesterase class I)
VEALLRWQNPELGNVPPDQFIPLAEETGLILPIGEWVLRRACAQAKTWEKMGLEPVRMAVNLSARQFGQADLAARIAQALDETGLDPRLLEIELTESMVMQNAQANISTLCKLRNMGLTISVDDFGTGYSSLSYLKRLPIHALKIDRAFVREVTEDRDDAAIVQAILALARSLRLHVVAEGIETASQLDFLRSHGCDERQGYLFSRPLPAEELTCLLLSGSSLSQ